MNLQTTSLSRSNQGINTAPFVYQGKIENLAVDGKLEDVLCRRLDAMNADQTKTILRDASALKELFLNQQVAAARAEADQQHSSEVTVDLGQGPQLFDVTKMPSGDYRLVNSEDPGYDISAQVILLQGGEHGHYAILSTRIPGSSEDQPDLLQTIKMSFTKSQNFPVAEETLHVGDAAQASVAPHIPAWDFNPNFKNVRPFER